MVTPKYLSVDAFDVYRKGWAKIGLENNKFGFINSDGKEVVPPIYDDVELFKETKNL